MRKITLALALVLAVAATALAGPDGTKYGIHTIHGMNYDRAALEKLLDDSEGPAEVRANQNGVKKLKGRFRLDKNKPVEEAALDFINRHRHAFRLKNPKRELKLDEKRAHKEGDTHIYYQQTYNGITVWQKIVSVHLDSNNDIDRISSGAITTPDIETTPLVMEEEAMEIAKDYCESKWPNSNPSTHRKFPTKLVIEKNRLVYIVTLFPMSKWWEIHVDAKAGDIFYKDDRTRY